MRVKQRATPAAGDELLRFELAYREHGARIWRSLLLYSGDRDVASDALAEAFAQAIGRGSSVQDPIAWVTRAAFRIAAGDLQQRRRTSARLPEQSYEMPDMAADLIKALEQLSPKQRAAAVLHFCDGYTLAEVAEIIGSTSGAVSVHLFRARAKLRGLLEKNDA